MDLLAQGPGAIEIWSFVVATIGMVASTAIAVVAVVLSVRATRESRRQAAEIEKAEARRRRAEVAHDMAMWFNSGSAFLMLPTDALTEAEADWSDEGESILFKARTFEHPFANELMQGAKKLRRKIPEINPIEKRMRAVMHVNTLFKFVASEWVVEPDKYRDISFDGWLDDEWLDEPAAE